MTDRGRVIAKDLRESARAPIPFASIALEFAAYDGPPNLAASVPGSALFAF